MLSVVWVTIVISMAPITRTVRRTEQQLAKYSTASFPLPADESSSPATENCIAPNKCGDKPCCTLGPFPLRRSQLLWHNRSTPPMPSLVPISPLSPRPKTFAPLQGSFNAVSFHLKNYHHRRRRHGQLQRRQQDPQPSGGVHQSQIRADNHQDRNNPNDFDLDSRHVSFDATSRCHTKSLDFADDDKMRTTTTKMPNNQPMAKLRRTFICLWSKDEKICPHNR